MTLKKTSPPVTSFIHTLAQYVSDIRVIVAVVVMLLVTAFNAISSILNYALTLKLSPLTQTVQAHEQQLATHTETLERITDNLQTIVDYINEPKVKLSKPIPDFGSFKKQ